MDINSALQKLYSLHQFGVKLGLENTIQLLNQIGNPHKNLRSFHVAGSNGKGSTASFMASILTEAGYKVGLYTSPHFVKFNERIRINGKMIEDEFIANYIKDLGEYIEKERPTFFETTTALAFKYFDEMKTDYAVIETGLGGRLDATNVIEPLASIITSISLEHTQLLGDTLEKIASEKAGIIKLNTPVFLGRIPFKAEEIILAKSEELNCNAYRIDDFTIKENNRVKVSLNGKTFSLYSNPLNGEHQFFNCALAIKTLNEVSGIKNGTIISRGIKNVVKNSGIQGRYEIFSENPKIIFDSAHNSEGVESFINEFSKEYQNYEESVLIFGAMRDKDILKMIKLLTPFFTKILISQAKYERAASTEEISAVLNNNNIITQPINSPADFIQNFLRKKGKRCLVVLGSMYLLGEIKLKIIEKKLDINEQAN